jgi:uncharacterized protein YndB with AHSA1/START domain
VVPAIFAAVLGLLAYRWFLGPWHRRWGATNDEVARPMPLDERVASPTAVSTRAITIDAPPERVWPWLAQMGDRPRAGYYSYTLVEKIQGLDVENAHRIMPEFQSLEVGQAIDKGGTMAVLAVDPGKHLVLGPETPPEWLESTWAFALYPEGRDKTRLVTRVRARYSLRGMLKALPWYTWPFWLLIDPGVFVMERKMLLEIKKHAEGRG